MDIAIVGCGNSGCGLAGDYAYMGHRVTLIKSSRSLHEENFAYLEREGRILLEDFGREKLGRLSLVTRDLHQVKGRELVILAVHTGYHRRVLERLLPLLEPGQLLLLVPGYLSTAYCLGLGAPEGLILAEAESNFIDGRISAPGRFRVGFRNVRDPIGVYPKRSLPQARALLSGLGTPFTYLGSVVEAALHNPNMIVHTVGAVMSIPRIEATGGDYCMYHEVFTPSVWRLLEALDGEKQQILSALGLEPLAYVEACKQRNSLDDSRPGKEVFFDYAAMPTRAKGPETVESRYITEDVPQGLGLMVSLGRALGIATPVAGALMDIASAALGRDFRLEGRSLEALGRENVERILADSREAPGWAG